MNLSFTIARRYFFSRKSGGSFNLITIISGISLLGYIVGAAALVIVLSVFNGFEGLFISFYNNFDPDIQVTTAKGKTFEPAQLNMVAIRKVDGIWKISEVLEEQALLRYDERQNIATVKGVDETYASITALDSCVVAGDPILQEGDTDYALAGQGIAYQLAIDPTNYFKRLVVYVPKRGETDLLNPFNRDAIFPVGIFSVQQEVDEKYVLVPLRFLRKLLDQPTAVSSLEMKLQPGANAERVKKGLQAICGEHFIIKNRFEQRDAFFKVMKTEKLMSYFILFFILLVAASNTIGSLYILVVEKKRDLKMLGSAGLTPMQAGNIFLFEGVLLAFVGGLLGVIVGVVLCYLQQQYGFIKLSEEAAFIFQAYPVEVEWTDVLLVFFTVLFLGWITALYPASKARRLVS